MNRRLVNLVTPQLKKSFLLLPCRLASIPICFWLWKQWIPNDDYCYVVNIFLAFGIMRLIVDLVNSTGNNQIGQTINKFDFLKITLLWAGGVTAIFGVIRMLVPHEIATNFNLIIPVLFIVYGLGLATRLLTVRKKLNKESGSVQH